MPSTRSVPSLTGDMQAIIRIVEVLPAPLGPRNPKDSPRPMSKSMSSTATWSPKRLTSPRAQTRASCSSGTGASEERTPIVGAPVA